MAYRSLILTAALALAFLPTAHAGYAQAAPPQGWTISGDTASFKAPAGSPANAPTYSGGVFKGTTTANMGRPITMPYSMRMASNAPRVIAETAFKNPRMFTPLGAAAFAVPLLVEWLGSEFRWNPEKGQFEKRQVMDGGSTCVGSLEGATPWCSNSNGPIPAGYCSIKSEVRGSGPTAETCNYIVPMPQTQPAPEKWNPATPGDLPHVMPQTVPDDMPSKLPFPLPVEAPVINPSPDPVPVPQPMRVPMSDPVPVPDTNPQEYKQPWVEIVPSPVPSSPWRVSMRPIETTTNSPTPAPETVTIPVTPSGTPSTPAAPTKDTQDFCALHPTALACLEKGNPGMLEPTPIFNENKEVSQIQKTGNYGPANGTCPTGQTLHIGSTPIELGYGSICEFATMINPLVIGFAWLSAAFTFFGFARKD